MTEDGSATCTCSKCTTSRFYDDEAERARRADAEPRHTMLRAEDEIPTPKHEIGAIEVDLARAMISVAAGTPITDIMLHGDRGATRVWLARAHRIAATLITEIDPGHASIYVDRRHKLEVVIEYSTLAQARDGARVVLEVLGLPQSYPVKWIQ